MATDLIDNRIGPNFGKPLSQRPVSATQERIAALERDLSDLARSKMNDTHNQCSENPHGERHCFHWRGQPPTLRTRVQADCCWCGVTRTFDYEDVMNGNAPISVQPSGAVHGTARDWLDQPVTYALGRLSAKGAARDHARKMAPCQDRGRTNG